MASTLFIGVGGVGMRIIRVLKEKSPNAIDQYIYTNTSGAQIAEGAELKFQLAEAEIPVPESDPIVRIDEVMPSFDNVLVVEGWLPSSCGSWVSRMLMEAAEVNGVVPVKIHAHAIFMHSTAIKMILEHYGGDHEAARQFARNHYEVCGLLSLLEMSFRNEGR